MADLMLTARIINKTDIKRAKPSIVVTQEDIVGIIHDPVRQAYYFRLRSPGTARSLRAGMDVRKIR